MAMIVFIFLSLMISFLIITLFFFLSKSENWDMLYSTGFECGFSSYFSSRFSFSVHYFLVALIFLFFDLELSFIFFFFLGYSSSFLLNYNLNIFVCILLLGLFLEWWELNLNWLY